jgi:hypothetical protein
MDTPDNNDHVQDNAMALLQEQQRQLQHLMQELAHQRQQLDALIHENVSLRASQLSTSATITSRPSTEPKVSPPPYFDGTKPSECRPFLSHCRVNFRTQPSCFDTEEKKVNYVIGHLRGPAFRMVEPYLDDSRTTPVWLTSFTDLADHLNSSFGVVDEKGNAERQLTTLEQTGSASSYYTRFASLANLLEWDDAALCSQFYRGLKPTVKDEISKVDRPTALDKLKDLAIRIDNRLFERQQERKAEHFTRSVPNFPNAPYTPRPRFQPAMARSSPAPTSPTPSRFGVPMDIDSVSSTPRAPITDIERKRRRDNHLCLYCGQPNHILANCPERRTGASNRPTSTPKVQTSELNLALDTNPRPHPGNSRVQ